MIAAQRFEIPEIRAAWDRQLDAYATAGRDGDAAAAAEAVLAVGPLRDQLAALNPLTVLKTHGADVAVGLAAIQESGRRLLWRLLLAAELAEQGDVGVAKAIAAQIDEAPRLMSEADEAIQPLLVPLMKIEPELEERFAKLEIYFFRSLVDDLCAETASRETLPEEAEPAPSAAEKTLTRQALEAVRPEDGTTAAGEPESTSWAWSEVRLAKAEIASRELASGAVRLLTAANDLEDHDLSYSEVDDAVAIAVEQDCLEDLLAQLPEPSRAFFFRTRLVTTAAFQQARAGKVEAAFETARSLTDKIDRSCAHEVLAMALLHQGLLADAECAALEINSPSSALCAIAAAHAECGAIQEARRVFDLVLERATHLTGLGEAFIRAHCLDLRAVRPLIADNMDLLLGEKVLEVTRSYAGRLEAGARREARDWLNGVRLPRRTPELEPPEPSESPEEERAESLRILRRFMSPEKAEAFRAKAESAARDNAAKKTEDPGSRSASERCYVACQRARELAAQGDPEARNAFAIALAAWHEVIAEDARGDEFLRLPLLALTASEIEPECAELLDTLEPFIERASQPARHAGRSQWRCQVAWALTDLGDWPRAFEVAKGIVSAGERYQALKWLVVRAPLNWLTAQAAFLEEEAVRALLLARLGHQPQEPAGFRR